MVNRELPHLDGAPAPEADGVRRPEPSRRPFVSHHEGAPPPPPPGGYDRGRSFPSSPYATAMGVLSPPFEQDAFDAQATRERRPVSVFGVVALCAASLFALILLILLAAGATDAIYGATMLALQLLVVAGAVAALFTAPGRTLAACALAVTLVLNVGTVGAMGALRTSAAGTYDGGTERERAEQAYPGMEGVDPADVLNAPSLEERAAEMDRLSAAVRERLSDEFGFTWVQVGEGTTRPERNGYGGESMLQQYRSPVWATNEPVNGYAQKLDVMNAIDAALRSEGIYYSMYPLNEADQSITDDSLEGLYGSADPRHQVLWEWYTEISEFPEISSVRTPLFYAHIIDLSNDDTGQWTTRQEAAHEDTGEPLEGLQLIQTGRHLLSQDDREEFEQRIADSPVG